MALGTFWALNIAFAAVSAAILVALLYIYGRNATQIKSKFTVGLVLFAVLFLVQNVAGGGSYLVMAHPSKGAEGAVPVPFLNGTEAGGHEAPAAATWRQAAPSRA